MRLCTALILVIPMLLVGEKCGATQQEAAVPAASLGAKAVGVVLKHYSLNPLALNPKTGQALPGNGTWAIAKTTPKSCEQSAQQCVEVFYRVPAADVQCSWVVSLNADGTDGIFLDENDDAGRYLLRKISQSEAGPLVHSRGKPVYPPIAIAAHVSGSVVMEAIVDEKGHTQTVGVVSGPPMLRAAALDAARKWEFTALTLGGKAAPYEVQLTFNFKTNGPPTGNIETMP